MKLEPSASKMERTGKKKSRTLSQVLLLSPGKNLQIEPNSTYRYNQKTYKVDRVDFAQSPETTFDKSGT